MKFELKVATTSKRLGISIADASSNVGAGLTGLVYNSSGLTWYYWREDEGNTNATVVTLATMTRGTWATGGFVEKDATNLPGEYEIGIPDAAFASGAKWVKMLLKGAANMVPVLIEVQLVAYNPDSATDLGLSTLTGNVPQTGDAYLRIGAAGVSLSAIPDLAGVTTLLSRLSAARAGYLDNLSAGAVAQAGTALSTVQWTNARAALLDFLDAAVSSRTKPADTQARVTLVDTLTTYTSNTPQTGDSFARIGAAGIGLSAIPDLAGVTTLLSRLSAARAGYLDNLSAGAVAQQANLLALITTVGVAGLGLSAIPDLAGITTLLSRVSAARAGYLDNLSAGAVALQTTALQIAGYVDTEIASILASLAALNNLAAGAAMTLTAGERLAIADAIRARALSESYPAISAAPTLEQLMFMTYTLLANFAFTGTDQSTKRIDNPATEAMGFQIDSVTAATTHTRVR